MDQYFQKSFKDIDVRFWISHYCSLLWRWRWYIGISFAATIALWVFFVFHFMQLRPEQESTIMIGFDKSVSISKQEIPQSNQDQIELIRSRNFLAGVVGQLSLQLAVEGIHTRNELFDSMHIDSTAQIGRYEVLITKEKTPHMILTIHTGIFKRPLTLESVPLPTIQTVSAPGLQLSLSKRFREKPFPFKFSISDSRVVSTHLINRIQLKYSQSTDNSFATVTLKGRDYDLDARTLNLMADLFVQKALSYRKNKVSIVAEILRQQLIAASHHLDSTENLLRKFKEQYPTTGLHQLSAAATDMSILDSNSNQPNADKIAQTRGLLNQIQNSGDLEKEIAYNEALGFLVANNVAAATALQNDYQQALKKRADLENAYSANHPLVIQNNNYIQLTRQQIHDQLKNYLAELEKNYRDQINDRARILKNLTTLPVEEMELARLERQESIYSDFYISVLDQYNQAKMADAVNLADVYVSDYAVPAEVPDFFSILLLRLCIGLGFALIISLAPAFISDLFDKTARSELELSHFFPQPVMETIPVVNGARKGNHGSDSNGFPLAGENDIQRALASILDEQDIVFENFRALRNKLSYQKNKLKSIAFTSWNAGEGKSLLAANTAIAFAHKNLHTLLIDCDLRHATVHDIFSLNNENGLSTLLSAPAPLTNGEVDLTGFFQQTRIPKLSIMCAGSSVSDPTELLGKPRFEHLVSYLSTQFDMLIIDTPPIGIVTDSSVISPLSDGFLIVVKAGSTNLLELKRSLGDYPELQQKIIGFLLNFAPVNRRQLRYRQYYRR